MAIYYAIGGLPAIIRVGFIQGILMLIGAVFLYGDLISAGGSLDIWERIPLDVLSMGIIACCVLVPLFLGIFWQRGNETADLRYSSISHRQPGDETAGRGEGYRLDIKRLIGGGTAPFFRLFCQIFY
ncbi:hypothetical protein [Methanothrix sp.]|uniref:hypothetical protein n=1 Tax=Methanothrix sp. TaxID=90426 RepID=UPI00329894D3